jgi:hypothetical protein
MNARNFLRTALLVSLFAAPAGALAQAATLDGRAFVAEAGEKGKAADEKGDVISFAGGKFHSSSCDQYGYGKGGYRTTVSGEAIAFEAETASEKDGRLVWKGTVRGDAIEGTFVHYRKGWLLNPNPEPIEHWFKGKAKS